MYPGNRGGPASNPFTGGVQMTPNQGGYGYPGVASPVYGQPTGYAGNTPGMPQYGYQGYGNMPQPQGNLAGVDPGMMNSQVVLNALQGIYIKQKMNMTEVITGINTANTYQIFELSGSGEPLRKQIFECKETSDCCDRMCVSPECRAISLDIRKVPMNIDYAAETVIRLVRECQCTCFCCNRPEMKIYYVEGGQNLYLGRVFDPFDCCSNNYDVFDGNNNKKFHVEAECCQLGFCCQCPCDSCQNIEFKLWSGDKQRQESSIWKRGAGCAKEAISLVDNFSVPFPMGSSWQDKALLIALTLMIDYLQFEEQPGNGGRSRHRGGYSAFD